MDGERWRRIREVLDRALAAAPEERTAVVEVTCRGDEELRAEVESLLAASGGADAVIRDLREAVEDGLRGLGPGKAASPEHRAGERIGPYAVERAIGRGGMGEVYLGRRADRAYEGRVAIKILPRAAGGDDTAHRFHQERQILATLDHPHIARLLDAGTTHHGQPFFVMEYVEGAAIDAWCDERRLAVPDRIRLFLKVVEAVQAAHRNLVVHRDLKPANVRVTGDGTPKLLDFGIAKLLDSRDLPWRAETTLTSLRPMTLSHASPEQLAGGPITTATDVYALGVTLYQLLTGSLPYRSDVPIHHAIVHEDPPPASTAVTAEASPARGTEVRHLRRLLRGDLDTILQTALAKDPARRYGSAEALAADLERHLEGLPVTARRPTLAYRTAKLVRRNPLAASLGVVLLAAGLAFTLAMALLADRLADERDRARKEESEARQVAELMVDLFSGTEPSRSRGQPVTAREVLDRGVDLVMRDLEDQPAILAALLDTIGRSYLGLGLHEEAAPLAARSLQIRRRILGPDDLATLESLSLVAAVEKAAGELARARELYQEVLDGRSRVLEPDSPLVAVAAEDLADVLKVVGEFAEAEARLAQAIAIRRARPDDRLGVSRALFGLALVKADQGLVAEAEALYREAHAARLASLGEDHPDTLEAQKGIAHMLLLQGRHAEAETAFRRLLALERRVFGAEHLRIPFTLGGIGFSVLHQGRAAEAEPFFREALRVRQTVLGGEHPAVAVSLNNLAFDLQMQGRHAEAEALFRQAVAQARRFFPPGTYNSSYPLVGLGEVLTARGAAADAEPLLREALDLRRTALGPENPLTAQAESSLGECLTALGGFEEAEALLLHAWSVQEENPGEYQTHREQTRRRLASLRQARGR